MSSKPLRIQSRWQPAAEVPQAHALWLCSVGCLVLLSGLEWNPVLPDIPVATTGHFVDLEAKARIAYDVLFRELSGALVGLLLWQQAQVVVLLLDLLAAGASMAVTILLRGSVVRHGL